MFRCSTFLCIFKHSLIFRVNPVDCWCRWVLHGCKSVNLITSADSCQVDCHHSSFYSSASSTGFSFSSSLISVGLHPFHSMKPEEEMKRRSWKMWILPGFFLTRDVRRVRSCECEWIHDDVIPSFLGCQRTWWRTHMIHTPLCIKSSSLLRPKVGSWNTKF